MKYRQKLTTESLSGNFGVLPLQLTQGMCEDTA